jgi:hypothetical protein
LTILRHRDLDQPESSNMAMYFITIDPCAGRDSLVAYKMRLERQHRVANAKIMMETSSQMNPYSA